MRIKTKDLTGQSLNHAVAQAAKRPVKNLRGGLVWVCALTDAGLPWESITFPYAPESSWATGGPLIEREGISLVLTLSTREEEPGKSVSYPDLWKASMNYNPLLCKYKFEVMGHTPLIAAMRCYVLSKLGEEVEVPEELL